MFDICPVKCLDLRQNELKKINPNNFKTATSWNTIESLQVVSQSSSFNTAARSFRYTYIYKHTHHMIPTARTGNSRRRHFRIALFNLAVTAKLSPPAWMFSPENLYYGPVILLPPTGFPHWKCWPQIIFTVHFKGYLQMFPRVWIPC